MIANEVSAGTSRLIVEKFRTEDDYLRARLLVATEARGAIARLLRDGVFPEPEDPLWNASRHGTWDAHAAAWEALEAKLLEIVEERPDGAIVTRPRFGYDSPALERESRILRALSLAEEIILDPVSNIFLNQGTEHLWRRVTGVGTQDQLFDNAHAGIGVGDNNTAAARTQTGLQAATNTAFAGMETGFPSISAGDANGGARAAFKAVFGANAANFGHKEWVIDNKGSGTPGAVSMNRKVQDFGLKESGSVWTYTFELRIN